jgi:integrase
MELEKGFNEIEDRRVNRIRTIAAVADGYLEAYKLRHKSTTFAQYALGHVKRLTGKIMLCDVSDDTVKDYQTARLREKASPKSINEEVGFLLRILEDRGDEIRVRMKRRKTLKLAVGRSVARAFKVEEKRALLEAARARQSPVIYPALMLALHAGVRDAENRGLQWRQIDLGDAMLTIGDSKSEAGEGRTIPLNGDVLAALVAHAKWYTQRFGTISPDWYVFPFGSPRPNDPTKPMTSLKKVWTAVRKAAGVTGRWHDNRHTFVTDLAESPEASDETIRDIAGHVSKQMLKHYSHIRMEAKRRAVAGLEKKPESDQQYPVVTVDPILDGNPRVPSNVNGKPLETGILNGVATVGRLN